MSIVGDVGGGIPNIPAPHIPSVAPTVPTVPQPPSSPSSVPAIGTAEYTKWYYDDPAGPGYNPESRYRIGVSPVTGSVIVSDPQTGETKETGMVSGAARVPTSSPQERAAIETHVNVPTVFGGGPSLEEATGKVTPGTGGIVGPDYAVDTLYKKWAPHMSTAMNGQGMFHGSPAQVKEYMADYAVVRNTTVPVYNDRGNVINVKRGDLHDLARSTGEAQYRKGVETGVLEDGLFIPGTAEHHGADWSAIPQSKLDNMSSSEREAYQLLARERRQRLEGAALEEAAVLTPRYSSGTRTRPPSSTTRRYNAGTRARIGSQNRTSVSGLK